MGQIIEQWAGHFSNGGSSDKVWAGAVSAEGTFYSTWGRRGGTLQRGEKPFGSQDAAFKEYRKKVGEKQREGYQAIPFNDPRYGVPENTLDRKNATLYHSH
jgi:predicted DNA-binding WGR domain protein